MIDYKNSKELNSWLRPMSRMVQFAKSIRAEVTPAAAASGDANGGDGTAVDPLADIDLDDLPDNIRKSIETAKTAFVDQQKAAKDAESKRVETEKFARDQQARADKNQALLQRHNLTEGSGAAVDPDDITQNPVYKETLKVFVADGLKPEVAATYAKMFANANKIQRAQIMEEVTQTFGPLVGSVNNVNADRAFRSAKESDTTGIFNIPEVDAEVRENMDLFVKNGRVLDEATVKNLAAMAFGNYASGQLAKGEPIVKTTQPLPTPTRGRVFPSLGTQHGGNLPVIQNQQREGDAPVAANAETAAAVAQTVAHFKKDLPSQVKKKSA